MVEQRIRFALLAIIVIAIDATDILAAATTQPTVELSTPEVRYQCAGWPVIVELKVTNVGDQTVSWSYGATNYPGTTHFRVEVRYGAEEYWHEIAATNGQLEAGTPSLGQIKRGESIVTPLAVPVRPKNPDDTVSIRITTTAEWRCEKPVECDIHLTDSSSDLDELRARVIAAAMPNAHLFWQHLAEQYADPVVIDAMLKLVTVDNALIVEQASRVLARQKTLPSTAGIVLGPSVAFWLPRNDMYFLMLAALNSQSETARRAILDVLSSSTDAGKRAMIVSVLSNSPGGIEWVQRAREACAGAIGSAPAGSELAIRVKSALERLDRRIEELSR